MSRRPRRGGGVLGRQERPPRRDERGVVPSAFSSLSSSSSSLPLLGALRGGGFPAAKSSPMLRTAAEEEPERRSLAARSATAVEVVEQREVEEEERLVVSPKNTSRSRPPSAAAACCSSTAALSTASACSLRPQRSRRALPWACVVTERQPSAWRKVSSCSQRDWVEEFRLRWIFSNVSERSLRTVMKKKRRKPLSASLSTHLRPGQVAAALCVLRAEQQRAEAVALGGENGGRMNRMPSKKGRAASSKS